MGKLLGIVLVFCGVSGILYSWISTQKECQRRWEETLLFLQKMVFAIQTERSPILMFLEKYEARDEVLQRCIKEMLQRLSANIYPKGQVVLQDVFKEEEKDWNWDRECFEILLRAGEGMFGRSREENVSLLQKTIEELENERKKVKERDEKERKVWIPVSMLGGMMLVILFL